MWLNALRALARRVSVSSIKGIGLAILLSDIVQLAVIYAEPPPTSRLLSKKILVTHREPRLER